MRLGINADMHGVLRQIEHHDHHGGHPRGDSHRQDERRIGDEIAAPAQLRSHIRGAFGKTQNLRLPLGERKRREQKHRKDQEPGRGRNTDGHDAQNEAQREQGREHEHVDHRLTLEMQRIGQRQSEVDGEHPDHLVTDEASQKHASRNADGDGRDGLRDPHAAGGEGAVALGPVLTVIDDVQQIIQEVRRGSEQAERQKSDAGGKPCAGICQQAGKHEGGEDEEVLRPLVQPQRPRPALQAEAGARHRAFDRFAPILRVSTRRRRRGPVGADDPDRAGTFPDMQVARTVSEIGKSIRKACRERICPGPALEVCRAVAGHDQVDEAEPLRKAPGETFVRSRSENDHAPAIVGRARICDDGLVEGQAIDVDLRMLGEPLLEHGLAGDQPVEQQKDAEGIVLHKGERHLVQHIRRQNDAIDVENERDGIAAIRRRPQV